MSRPLISYVVATFNQERFVRVAVECAFAQTYSPLEILISDDVSKDRTFEIAREMAAGYKGPHTVRLNQNPTNLGIGGHTNRLMELCRGELVVAGAGDDMSVPHRCQTIWQAWEESGREATSVFSSYTYITTSGVPQGVGGLRGDPTNTTRFQELRGGLPEFLASHHPAVNGCTHAWSRKLFDYFGPIRTDWEDLVLSFRTLVAGKMIYIQEPLVKYRRHDNNVSFFAEQDDNRSFEHRERRLRWVDEQSVRAYDTMIMDIDTACQKGRIPDDEASKLKAQARRLQGYYSLERQLMDGGMASRWLTLARAAGNGHSRLALRFLPRALPYPLYRRLYLLRHRWRAAGRAGGKPIAQGA